MDKCKPTETLIALGTKLTKNDDGPTINSTLYKIMVGSLMYLTATRPDLMYVVKLIKIFLSARISMLLIFCRDSEWINVNLWKPL